MIHVLQFTSLLPIQEIDRKKNENDILLVTEENLKHYHPDVQFHYVFISPKVNKLLSFLNARWKAYHKIQQGKSYQLRGRTIFTMGIIMLPQKLFFQNFLYAISYWLNRKLIEDIIIKTNATIVHAQSIGASAYFAYKISKKYNIPYVVTLRGAHSSKVYLNLKILGEANHLIAINHIHRKVIESKLSKNIQIIPHGISESFFNNKTSLQPIDILHFIAVCHLKPGKNIDKVIKSLSKINRDYHFNVYGEGPEKANLQKLINQLGIEDKVKLMGHVKNIELPEILKMHHIFVMPSARETLGRVYFEAMASGLPVIATKDTGIDGIITDGVEGFLADMKDSQSLDNIIQTVVYNPEIIFKMRQNALQLAQKYKWEAISNLLYDVYTK